MKQEVDKSSEDINAFQGRVFDAETKEPLIGVSIVLIREQIGIVSDFDGNFRLEIPAGIKDQKIEIKIAYLGYEMDTLIISPRELNTHKNIYMKPTSVLMGGVCGQELSFRNKARRFFSRKY